MGFPLGKFPTQGVLHGVWWSIGPEKTQKHMAHSKNKTKQKQTNKQAPLNLILKMKKS